MIKFAKKPATMKYEYDTQAVIASDNVDRYMTVDITFPTDSDSGENTTENTSPGNDTPSTGDKTSSDVPVSPAPVEPEPKTPS